MRNIVISLSLLVFAGCGRTGLSVGTDAGVPPCEWSVGPAIELERRDRSPLVFGAAVRPDANLAMVVVDEGGPAVPAVAIEVSLDEPRVVRRLPWSRHWRGLWGVRGGWMTQVIEDDGERLFLQRLDGSMRIERDPEFRTPFTQTPTSLDSVHVTSEGIEILSLVDNGTGYTQERARDPILMHQPVVIRMAPGEWIVIGNQLGLPGAARIGGAPAEYVPLNLLGVASWHAQWGGDSRVFVGWHIEAGPSGVGVLDAETLTLERWDTPVPLRGGRTAFVARSDLLYLPTGGDDPSVIAIRRGETTILLELGDLLPTRPTVGHLFGRLASNVAAIHWVDREDRSAWLAPLRCD